MSQLNQKEVGYTTPKAKTTLPEPVAPYKKKLRNYSDLKKIKEEKPISDLVLFDDTKKKFKCYTVYNDQKIGVDTRYQKMLVKSQRDDDCESQESQVAKAVDILW